MHLSINIIFSVFICIAYAVQIFSLPGNWIALGLFILWASLGYAVGLNFNIFIVLFLLALTGEVLELLVQLKYGKKHGSSSPGNVGGIIGAIAGAIMGIPFFFGFGAILGILIGAYLGCFVFEMLLSGRSYQEASKAALGAMQGRFFGISIKLGIGFSILVIGFAHAW